MDYDFKVEEKREELVLLWQGLVYKRELRSEIEFIYKQLLGLMGRSNIYPRGHGFIIYNYEEGSEVDISVGFPIAKKIVTSGNIRVDKLKGRKVVSCIHTGSYDGLKRAYEKLDEFLEERALGRPINRFEIHKNEIADTIEHDLITEVGYTIG